jgi:hypothetical protein
MDLGNNNRLSERTTSDLLALKAHLHDADSLEMTIKASS